MSLTRTINDYKGYLARHGGAEVDENELEVLYNIATAQANPNAGQIEILNAAKTINRTTDANKTFFIGGAGKEITLPAVDESAGFAAEFIVSSSIVTTNWTIVADNTVIQGGAFVAGSFAEAANEGTITFVHTVGTLGDKVSLRCDGTNWYVEGVATSSGAITFT